MKKIFLTLQGSLILVINVFAQTDVYNSGQIYITNSSDTVYITGSLNNTNSAGLNNAGGNIYILRDLNNSEPNMLAGGGKLWFTGTVLQNITGTQPFRTNNWKVNNTAGVNLQNRIGVGNGTGGTLDFINGMVTSGTQLQDVFFYPNSAYTGYADNKHIIGYCSKSGSTNFTYPIGNGTLKADLDIFNLGSVTDFQCKYFGVGYGTYTPQSPLVSVFDQEYWTLDRTAGASSARITLKWNDARKPLNHAIPSDLRAGHYTGTVWINEGGTGTGNTATGTVSSVAVNSFSPFTFASINSVLPLKITAYNVTVNNCQVNIRWTSEDETDVSKYIIQKSSNGQSWENIASININTTINTVSTHVYTDDKVTDGDWMYRVKVDSKNGDYFYTSIKTARLSCSPGTVSVYPSLVKQNLTISIPANIKVNNIIIYNSYGQLIKTISNPVNHLTTLNLSGYPAGVYNIIVDKPGGIQNFKIIKAN
jgi:hypothetical protein